MMPPAPPLAAARHLCHRAARTIAVATGLLAVLGGALRLFWAVGAPSLAAATTGGPTAPADLLLVAACVVGTAVTLWLGSTALLVLAMRLPGAVGSVCGHLARRVAPVAVHRAVAVLVGGALLAGVPAHAHADTPRPTRPTVTTTVTSPSSMTSLTSLSTLSTLTSAPAPSVAPAPDPSFPITLRGPAVDGVLTPPSAPVSSVAPPPITATPTSGSDAPDPAFVVTPADSPPRHAAPSLGPLGPATRGGSGPAVAAPAPQPASPSVRVSRGDTLWTIAARRLGADATPSAIAREWHRWYAENRTLIGPDPDLIHAGQVLNAPPTAPAPTSGTPHTPSPTTSTR